VSHQLKVVVKVAKFIAVIRTINGRVIFKLQIKIYTLLNRKIIWTKLPFNRRRATANVCVMRL